MIACECVCICLHIKVFLFPAFYLEHSSLFISPPSPLVALFWTLNGQQRIRGPSGVTFFIVERHNQ